MGLPNIRITLKKISVINLTIKMFPHPTSGQIVYHTIKILT